MTDISNQYYPTDEQAYLKSSFYEKLAEHVFISEILQETWYGFGKITEVLHSEVDASGYDVVFDCNGYMRHVQLKMSKAGGKAAIQKVNIALAEKPSGCVVWILREEVQEAKRMRMSFRYFGSEPGEKLPVLDGLPMAKHTKGNKDGVKAERPAIRLVPRARFVSVATTTELVGHLFGLKH